MANGSEIRGRRQYALQREFCIDKLYTFHYYELSKSFYTKGEKHDFWELVYVDKGKLEVFTDDRHFVMTQGDMTLYHPNLHHKVSVEQATNLMIVSFDMTATCMSALVNQTFRLTREERFILTEMLKEGYEAFDPPITTLFQMYLGKRGQSAFGCEHLIMTYLEMMIIKLLRRVQSIEAGADSIPLIMNMNPTGQGLLGNIKSYMKSNVSENLSLDSISEKFYISKTRLKTLFKEDVGIGVMQYYNHLKIEEAKTMIREEAYTYTEIAERLGYSSSHYFFNTFKKATGMTPTEYAQTVHSKIRRHAEAVK
ncbi:helix-turn-helix domain-containing protein [Paenibacillus hemerocallicola]|uniref:Helix-turn-helix domain-containing protein n=1 Tax=Paenibacillus hemerocallicola TaxID=1172614 RepID=A0A5C4T9V4_9BACL|nr:AraC family transcriptional regulator [Paenibacillus hemerocallicola]TNJ65506.1 helix-turn-helix domain-containing protein [Paenibacillus hemerocallicola]